MSNNNIKTKLFPQKEPFVYNTFLINFLSKFLFLKKNIDIYSYNKWKKKARNIVIILFSK